MESGVDFDIVLSNIRNHSRFHDGSSPRKRKRKWKKILSGEGTSGTTPLTTTKNVKMSETPENILKFTSVEPGEMVKFVEGSRGEK